MKRTIFIDLDGTILDVSERIYQVYKDILRSSNHKFLSSKDYLKLKRKKATVELILRKTGAENISSKFKKEWKEKIEKPTYLTLDKINPSNKKTLLYLKQNSNLVLVSLRNYPKRLIQQLRNKKIEKIFKKILTIASSYKSQRWKLKQEIIRKYRKYNRDSIIIGDTETDILTGKKLGIKTVAVLNGMRNKEFLKKQKPDFLIEDINKIKKIIKENQKG